MPDDDAVRNARIAEERLKRLREGKADLGDPGKVFDFLRPRPQIASVRCPSCGHGFKVRAKH